MGQVGKVRCPLPRKVNYPSTGDEYLAAVEIPKMAFIVLILLVACGALGGIAAERNQAFGWGFFLGLVFGPLGVMVACFIDNRPLCPRCGGPSNSTSAKPFPVCSHCGADMPGTSGKENGGEEVEEEWDESEWDEADWKRAGQSSSPNGGMAGLL